MSAFILLDVPHVGQRDIGAYPGHASRSELKWDEPWTPGISLMYRKRPDSVEAAGFIARHRDLMWW